MQASGSGPTARGDRRRESRGPRSTRTTAPGGASATRRGRRDAKQNPSTKVIVGGLVVATAVVGGVTRCRASNANPLASTTFAASTASFPNPDRGFYHYTQTTFNESGASSSPLSAATASRWRSTDNVTLVYRVYYLGSHTSGPLPQRTLDAVAADLAAARRAGVRLIVRFAYSPDAGKDAAPDVVTQQIAQLAPVLNQNKDVIAFLQAGFIGRWGEWYYTDHYAHNTANPTDLNDADWAARGRVLNALLNDVSSDIPVQVRYPEIVQRLVPADSPQASRVGIHDDCFLADDNDSGTYRKGDDRSWLGSRPATAAVGGETCNAAGAHSGWDNAQNEMSAGHWTYLNADFQQDVLKSWGSNLNTAAQRLGYRLRLASTALPATVTPGADVKGTITFTNDGFAAPTRNRPVQLILRNGTATRTSTVNADLTGIGPGATVTVPVNLTAPATAGAWKVSLALPDPSSRLADNPAYAVQLANPGVWNARRGTNDLPVTLTVQPQQ